jgi:hypothetical protein
MKPWKNSTASALTISVGRNRPRTYQGVRSSIANIFVHSKSERKDQDWTQSPARASLQHALIHRPTSPIACIRERGQPEPPKVDKEGSIRYILCDSQSIPEEQAHRVPSAPGRGHGAVQVQRWLLCCLPKERRSGFGA